MTLIGIWSTEPGRAFAWCDDECFLHNFVGPPTPSGHIHKMAVNDEAEAVVVTMGDKLLIDIAAEVVARSIVFDSLADALAVQARFIGILSKELKARELWSLATPIASAGSLALSSLLATSFSRVAS